MAQKKVTPKGGLGKAWQVRTQVEVHTTPAELPASTESVAPTTEEGPPTPGKVVQRREKVKKLEWVGRSPELSLMRQLAEMAAKVGPLMSAGDEPSWKKLQPIVEAGPPERSSKSWTVEEATELLTRDCSSL